MLAAVTSLWGQEPLCLGTCLRRAKGDSQHSGGEEASGTLSYEMTVTDLSAQNSFLCKVSNDFPKSCFGIVHVAIVI